MCVLLVQVAACAPVLRASSPEPANGERVPSYPVSIGVSVEEMVWKNEAQRIAVEKAVIESRDVDGDDGTVFVSALAVEAIESGLPSTCSAGKEEKEGSEEKGKEEEQKWKGVVLGMRCAVRQGT